MESEILLFKSGILRLGIRNRSQGFRNPTESGIQNPSSTYKDCNPVAGIRNSRRGLQNPDCLGFTDWGEFLANFAFVTLCTFVDELSNIALESA